MQDYFYKLAVQSKWASPFLSQLKNTSKAINNSYNSQRNALNTKYNNSVSNFNNQKETKKAEAIKKGKEAYVNYAKSINPFSGSASNLARLGLGSSGFAESENIRTNNAYQTNVGNIDTERDLALAELDKQIASVENERRSELARLLNSERQDQYENYYKIRQLREDERNRQLALEAARKAAARASSSSRSSGGYVYPRLTNTKSETMYTANSTPVFGFANASNKKAVKWYEDNITKTIKAKGYISQSELNKKLASSGLTASQKKKVMNVLKKK